MIYTTFLHSVVVLPTFVGYSETKRVYLQHESLRSLIYLFVLYN